jgi:hypothetical protein
MITVFCVSINGDEYYGTSMADVRWLLRVKDFKLPVTFHISQCQMSKAEFEALPEWGL